MIMTCNVNVIRIFRFLIKFYNEKKPDAFRTFRLEFKEKEKTSFTERQVT